MWAARRPLLCPKRVPIVPIVASMISSSFLPIQLTSPPASGEHGAKTSSSIDSSGS